MPQLHTLIALLLRHALGGLGAYFGLSADLDEEAMQAVVGAIMALLAVGWSVYEKKQGTPQDVDSEIGLTPRPKIHTEVPKPARDEDSKWVN